MPGWAVTYFELGMTALSYTSSNGKTYYLHSGSHKLGGNVAKIYFFSLKVGPGAIPEIPPKKRIVECQNGFPILRNK